MFRICRNLTPVCFGITSLLFCSAVSTGAGAQSLSSVANVDGLQHSTNTNSAVEYYYNPSSLFAYAYARTDFGVNHAEAQLNLTAPYPFFNVSGTSSYQESFTYAVTNGLSSSLTPTAVQFMVTMDGNVNLPTGFNSSSYIQVLSTSAANGSASSSTTDVNATLYENSYLDKWSVSQSVSHGIYTTQAFAITGGLDVVTVSLNAGITTPFINSQAGNAAVDFSNTALLTDAIVYDQHGDIIPTEDLVIHSASGGHYAFTSSTPEPSSLASIAFMVSLATGVSARKRRVSRTD